MADLHLAARSEAMPYLHQAHSDDETRRWFAGAVCDRPARWWVARCGGRVVGYMLIDGKDLDHLYVRPGWQRRGIGLSLLDKAKTLSSHLVLSTFQRNANARAFYEAHGFRIIGYSDGRNEENEPDVQYSWNAPRDRPDAPRPLPASRGPSRKRG